MSIKRRLNAIAKNLTPTIESMNQGIEMDQLTSRLEGLVEYCEQKQERIAERKKSGGKSAGQIAAEKLQAERDRVQKIHDEEAEEQLKDRQQAKAQPDAG